MIQSITDTMVMRDTAAVIAMIDSQRSARRGAVGVVGYCMGGGFALSAAGTFPDRVVAAASFHGGSLATDKPDSAHRLAIRMRARVYVGVAEIDASFSPEQQHRLEKALSEGGVDFSIETYKGAKHGFAVTGHLVYDRDSSERHWQRLLHLFKETLHNAVGIVLLAQRCDNLHTWRGECDEVCGRGAGDSAFGIRAAAGQQSTDGSADRHR